MSTLMVLITVISIGLLSLASINPRISGTPSQLQAAKANARLAMMLAIGELQKEADPDQRIPSAAGVFDANPDSAAADNPPHPQWLGAWKPRHNWLNADGIQQTYHPGRVSHFRRWLVSHPDPSAMTDASRAA